MSDTTTPPVISIETAAYFAELETLRAANARLAADVERLTKERDDLQKGFDTSQDALAKLMNERS